MYQEEHQNKAFKAKYIIVSYFLIVGRAAAGQWLLETYTSGPGSVTEVTLVCPYQDSSLCPQKIGVSMGSCSYCYPLLERGRPWVIRGFK